MWLGCTSHIRGYGASFMGKPHLSLTAQIANRKSGSRPIDLFICDRTNSCFIS